MQHNNNDYYYYYDDVSQEHAPFIVSLKPLEEACCSETSIQFYVYCTDSSRLLPCVHNDPMATVSAIERIPAAFSRVGVGVKAAEVRSFSLTVISTPWLALG